MEGGVSLPWNPLVLTHKYFEDDNKSQYFCVVGDAGVSVMPTVKR